MAAPSLGRIPVDTGKALIPTDSHLLDNDVLYRVQVRAVDSAGNVSLCSEPVEGTPQVINDFWRQYQQSGGGQAGCAHATSGTALLTLLGLLALRRRKDPRS
jgi:MYXO-CTERM domain-containing protein